MSKIDFKKVIEEVKDPWEPRDIVQINNTSLRVVKIDGSYRWHSHKNEDELFFVLKGTMFVDTEAGAVELNEMESYLVKSGIRHRSRSDQPAWILLIEPTMTITRGEDS